jgi:UDP-N-acetylglucosamine enolpyruvyl transferase
MKKHFPILEAAADHIEINGQMHQFPVYLKKDNGNFQIYKKIISYTAMNKMMKDTWIETMDFYTVGRCANINRNFTYFESYVDGCTIITEQEFNEQFQHALKLVQQ